VSLPVSSFSGYRQRPSGGSERSLHVNRGLGSAHKYVEIWHEKYMAELLETGRLPWLDRIDTSLYASQEAICVTR